MKKTGTDRVHAALDALDLVGHVERLIAAILREQVAVTGDRMTLARWVQGHNDRARKTALAALATALDATSVDVPADALPWLREGADPPCWIDLQTRADLRAKARGAVPEGSLFDDVAEV